MDYFYVDVETVPNDKEAYLALSEEGRKKLLNPIDSRIVAIGVKKNGQPAKILFGDDEDALLSEFWSILSAAAQAKASFRVVGFNIKDFDLPFLVTRSFVKGVRILPFLLKEVVDIREYLSVFKFGPVRGKLKEYALLLGIPTLNDMEGSRVAETFWAGEHETIKAYLSKDLEITEAMHARMIDLRITDIARW